MQTRKSLFEELNEYASSREKEDVINSRADHIIASAINLLESVISSYPPEYAEQIEKKFISSIKQKDPSKFKRAVNKMKGEINAKSTTNQDI